jgi:site-specific recombinase XerD
MNLLQALDAFILACQADGLAPATVKHYESKLRRLCHSMGQAPIDSLDSITTNDLRRYIIDMRQQTERYIDAPQKPTQAGGYSPESVNTHIRALHRFFKWCALEYDIPNPMAKIRYPQPQKQAPKGISTGDIIRMLQVAGDDMAGARDRAIVAFLADTGCRLGGLVGLTANTLYLERRQALLVEKGNNQRMVGFTLFTHGLLSKWLEHHPGLSPSIFTSMNTGAGLTHSGVSLMLKRLKARAGITGRANAHAFRHNFAREFIINGGDISILAKILGHKSMTTTAAFYAIFTEDELSEIHAKFSPLNNLSS